MDESVAPVVVVRLQPGADPVPLLSLRATTLAVVSPGLPGRFLMDELPDSPEVLVQGIVREPWCAGVAVHWAVTGLTRARFASVLGDVPLTVQVHDPVLGCLTYALFPTLDAACAAFAAVASDDR